MIFLSPEIHLPFLECVFNHPKLNVFFCENRQKSNARPGPGNALPKFNARADLRQRKTHSGLNGVIAVIDGRCDMTRG